MPTLDIVTQHETPEQRNKFLEFIKKLPNDLSLGMSDTYWTITDPRPENIEVHTLYWREQLHDLSNIKWAAVKSLNALTEHRKDLLNGYETHTYVADSKPSDEDVEKLRRQLSTVFHNESEILAYKAKKDHQWRCLSCFCFDILNDDNARVADFYTMLIHRIDCPLNHPDLEDSINEWTLDYTQVPGGTVPMEGIRCCSCNNQIVEEYVDG